MSARNRADGGSAAVVMIAVITLSAMLALELWSFAQETTDGLRAQSLADAAALAAVVGSRSMAENITGENGGDLIECVESSPETLAGSTVRVTIELNGHRATAWASDEG